MFPSGKAVAAFRASSEPSRRDRAFERELPKSRILVDKRRGSPANAALIPGAAGPDPRRNDRFSNFVNEVAAAALAPSGAQERHEMAPERRSGSGQT
jgi:hypothetical protein